TAQVPAPSPIATTAPTTAARLAEERLLPAASASTASAARIDSEHDAANANRSLSAMLNSGSLCSRLITGGASNPAQRQTRASPKKNHVSLRRQATTSAARASARMPLPVLDVCGSHSGVKESRHGWPPQKG